MKPVLYTASDPAEFNRQQDSAAGQKESPKEHQGNASRLHSNVEKQPGKLQPERCQRGCQQDPDHQGDTGGSGAVQRAFQNDFQHDLQQIRHGESS